MSAYTIKVGDTLSNIAKQHNTTVAKLVTLNGIQNPNLIHAGHVLLTSLPEIPVETKKQLEAAVIEGAKVANTVSLDPIKETVKTCPAEKNKPEPKFIRALGKHKGLQLVYIEADGLTKNTDNNKDDAEYAEGSASMGLIRLKQSGHVSETIGGRHKLDAIVTKSKGSMGSDYGIGIQGETKIGMIAEEATVFLGDDENNPWVEAGGEYTLLQTEAKGEFLLGSDGKRAGLAFGAKASATAASADIKGEINIPVPFTDWTISLRGKGGGSIGSVGGGGSAYAYQDLESKRVHIGASGKIAVFFGISADVDLSVGPKFKSRKD